MWRKLGFLWTAVILAVTTLPWSTYASHAHWCRVRWIPFYDRPLPVFDLVANLALFAPFGFFLTRALPKVSRRSAFGLTLVLAAMLSASVEYFQVYCHDRIASTTDICMNMLGAVLGVMVAWKRSSVS